MRKVLRLGVVVVLAACGGDRGEGGIASSDPFCQRVLPAVETYMERARAEHPTPEDERYGGTVVVGTIGEITDGMMSASGADYAAVQHQQFVNLMTLVRYDESLEPVPYLAESWDVASDHSSVTFHLRRDVTWHDGEQTDAHDVAFTYRTVIDPATAFPNAAFWDQYDKSETGIEVVDDFTVTIRMSPHSQFLDAWRAVGILPEHLLGDVAPEDLKQHPFATQCPVGNGPFVFDSHRPQDRWVFVANPGFPQDLGGRPFLDRYIYRVIPEQTTLLTELLTENLDLYVQPRPDQVQRILDDPRVDLWHFVGREYVFVAWNTRRPQLADSRVRQAITLGTNREEIVEAILQGYGAVADAGVPSFHWAFDSDIGASWGYDPDAARALLDDAGWTDRDGDGVRESSEGTRLSFSIKYNTGNQNRQDVAEIMQAQLAKIGMEVQPEVVDFSTLLQQIASPDVRDFDGVVMKWITEFKLDDMDLFHSDRVDQPWAFSGIQSPEIDRLLELLSSTVDRERSIELWAEYQRALAEEHPYTFFYFPERLNGLNKRVKGVEMDARGEWLNIKDWYLDPESR